MRMNAITLHDFLKHDHADDEWWLAVDGKMLDGPVSSREVERLCRELPKAQLHILHVSETDSEEAVWQRLEMFQAEKPAQPEPQKASDSDQRLAQL